MKPMFLCKNKFIGMLFYVLLLCPVFQGGAGAEIDFFSSPNETSSAPGSLRGSTLSNKKATILFFVAPGCGSCPEEASRLETELKKLGWNYEITGIFVGTPTQVGKYLAELRRYPFNFELELDMDGTIAGKYGVKTFPAAVIEVSGKIVVVTKASEIPERLR